MLFRSATSGTNDIGSVYVKGYNGTSGVIDVAMDLSATGNACGCAYNGTTWTRCAMTVAHTGSFTIGNDGSTTACGSGTRSAVDVLVWGGQRETGAYATSYIPTTSAAATRNAETGVSLTLSTGTWPTGSGAYAFTPLATGISAGQMTFGTNARVLYGNATNLLAFDGTNNPSTPSGSTAGTSKRYWSSWSTAGGWTVRNATDGNQATSAFTSGTWAPDTTLDLTSAFLGTSDGIISRVCLDPDTTRCR